MQREKLMDNNLRCRNCKNLRMIPLVDCEHCGAPVYDPEPKKAATMAKLSIVCLIGSMIVGFPKGYLLILAGLTVFLIINAIAKNMKR